MRSSVPDAVRTSASRRRRSRRERSDIALPQFVSKILGRTPRECDDRVSGILVGIAHEGCAVCDKQVLHVVRLTVLIQHARLAIVSHADCPDLVDDGTTSRDRWTAWRRLLAAATATGLNPASERLEDCSEGLLHVPDLVQLVIAPRPMEAKHRNPPSIDDVRIDFAER